MLLILALAVWLSGVGTAAAHTCMTPVDVVVGQPAALTIGVPAEGVTPLVAVELTIPDGFEVAEAPSLGGWHGAVDGSVVRFSGHEVPGGACGYVVVKGVATRRGTFVIATHTRDADGTERVLDRADPQNPRAGQVVTVRRVATGSGGGWLSAMPGGVRLGGALAVVAGLGVAVLAARRARARRPVG
jgi:hypothetical protein